MSKSNRDGGDFFPSQACETMGESSCCNIVDAVDPSCVNFVTEVNDSTGDYLDMVVEAAIFSSSEPVSLKSLLLIFNKDTVTEDVLGSTLLSIRARYQGRGVELTETASGWSFKTSAKVQYHLDRLRQVKPPRYSRAVMETLAVVAYRQPVTRGDIEEIRGVSVSPQIIRTLEDRGWIAIKGRRESVGRPVLYTTTIQFLDDFGLQGLDELPALQTFGPVLEPMDDLSTKEKS